MPTTPTRRSFLRWFGAGTGVAAAAACRGDEPARPDHFSRALDKPHVPGAEQFDSFEERWVTTSCAQCAAGCGIRVRVVEGRAIRIEGNPDNPLNRGGIGPRGLAGLQVLYDADRLTGPMRRDGGALVPTTWDSALGELAERLAAVRGRGEPHRVVVVTGTERGMRHDLWQRFCRAYGTPNFIEGARTAVMSQAMAAAVGSYAPPAFDWVGARFVLSLEAGLLEDSCQSVYFTRAAAELRGRRDRAKIVHAGPAFDLCAYNADEWIRIAPGTSGALALGLAHVLVRDGKLDRDFIRDRSTGFDAFAATLAEFEPARVAAVTGAPVATIERLAAEIADSGAGFAIVDERSLSFSNGLDTAGATLALNAVVGAIGRDHAGLVVEPSPPYAPWPEVAVDAIAAAGLARPRLDGAGTAPFPRSRGVHDALPAALGGPDGPEIALLFHTNPAWARAQPATWRAALAKVPLVVSFSPFRDETVDEVAHLVLPDHTYLERWEDAAAAPGTGKPVAGIRRPVVDPVHDTRSTADVVIELARALGGPVAAALPWRNFPEAMEARLVGLFDAHRGKVGAAETTARGPRELIDGLYREGFWADLDARPAPVRFQFPVGWAEPAWAGDPAEFPLTLLAYRPLGYAEGSGANQPWLQHLRSRPQQRAFSASAAIHPTSAAGIADGDVATITSAWGSIAMPIRHDHRMRPGCIAVPLGGGHTAMGRWARGVGVNPMTILAPGPAPKTGANAICTTRVSVRRVGRA